MPVRDTWKLRYHIRRQSIRALQAAGLLKAARAQAAQNGNTLVLMLHRVMPDKTLLYCRSPRGMVLGESSFRRLLTYLAEHATFVLPENAGRAQTDSGRPRVLVTFDDGWADNYEIAAPLLARFGVKACFFTVTAYTGCTQPFWPERVLGLLRTLEASRRLDLIEKFFAALPAQPNHGLLSSRMDQEERLLGWMKQFAPARICSAIQAMERQIHLDRSRSGGDPLERLMTWDELRSLARAGHTIASHTSTHALLTQLTLDKAAGELRNSAEDLKSGLWPERAETRWIAYPNGDCDERVRNQAYGCGYRYGFTTIPGIWCRRSESLAIPRVNIWEGSVRPPKGIHDESYLDYNLFWRPLRSSGH